MNVRWMVGTKRLIWTPPSLPDYRTHRRLLRPVAMSFPTSYSPPSMRTPRGWASRAASTSASGWRRTRVGLRSDLTVSIDDSRGSGQLPRADSLSGQPTLAGVVERECHGGTCTGGALHGVDSVGIAPPADDQGPSRRVISGQEREVDAQQPPDLGGYCGEQLLRRRRPGDERRHATQRGLLLGVAPQLRAGPRVSDAAATSSVKPASHASVSAGTSSCLNATPMTPDSRPSRLICTPTTERPPNRVLCRRPGPRRRPSRRSAPAGGSGIQACER
jgi:hypothetical protein